MQRILIIGAGLIGAALAYRLSQAGAQVTVVDAAQPASAASGASFGWINASFFHSPTHFNLRAAAIQAHHRLDRDMGNTGTIWSGCLWWEEEGAALDRQARTLTTLGYKVDVLDARQIAAREPALSAPRRCLFFPDEGAVDAAHLTRRLLSACNAALHTDCPVTSIETLNNRAIGATTAQGTFPADHVILAAGTACPALLAPFGLTLPMLRRPGMVLRTRPVGARLAHILASPTQEVRQDRDGCLIAPLAAAHQGDEAEDLPAQSADLAATTLARLNALLPNLTIRPDQIGFAFRPVPGDGLPCVGPTGIAGLTLAVMHSGVTLAPLVAELLAGEIAGGPPSPLLADFRPARFFG